MDSVFPALNQNKSRLMYKHVAIKFLSLKPDIYVITFYSNHLCTLIAYLQTLNPARTNCNLQTVQISPAEEINMDYTLPGYSYSSPLIYVCLSIPTE